MIKYGSIATAFTFACVFSCARAYGDTYERALWLGMFAASALGLAATVIAFVNRDRA